MVVLKRLADAERDGDRIYCVVSGVGASRRRGKSVYAPVAGGPGAGARERVREGGVRPGHGRAGRGPRHRHEGRRRRRVRWPRDSSFDATDRADRQWCALGSVKTQIGHTKAAAGAAGLIKAVMALHHKVLPPTIKIDKPNPKLDLEQSPFYLNTRTRPWMRGSDHERRGSVSSFGFGGSNFHVALEEYTGPALERHGCVPPVWS